MAPLRRRGRELPRGRDRGDVHAGRRRRRGHDPRRRDGVEHGRLGDRGVDPDRRRGAAVDLLGTFTGFTIPFPTYEAWYGTFNGNSSTLARNGTQSWAGRAGSASQNGFTLGALNSSGQYGYQFSHSRVAEVLWYSGTM